MSEVQKRYRSQAGKPYKVNVKFWDAPRKLDGEAMAQKYFIKATLEGMTASYDKSKYRMGENIHPSPDLSNVVCGEGFHLARTVTHALGYVPYAKEFYLATAGKILGADETKVRTGRCTLLLQIPQDYIDDYKKEVASAWEDYKKEEASAWEDYYGKAAAFAREVYEEEVASAREAYEKVEASAHRKFISKAVKVLQKKRRGK